MAIVTGDEEYGKALCLALVNAYKTFTVTLYKSEQVFKSARKQFDLVIKDFPSKEPGDIQLVEKQSMIVKDSDNRKFCLYKYSNVRELAKELLYIYSLLTGRKAFPVRNEALKIVMFSASAGGVGCTTAAMAFCQELKRFHNKNVLYLSLEEIESTLEYMEQIPGGKSLSEYLYHLFNSKGEVTYPFLESFLLFDCYGVDAFLPSMGRNLLNTLTAEEMQFFIGSLIDSGQYDFIIIDAGCNLGKGALCCYEMANHICLIETPVTNPYKENRLIEYMMFLKGEHILDRMGKVAIGNRNDEGDGEDALPVPLICQLPVDKKNIDTINGIKTVALDGAYGQGIKTLADSILKITNN